MGARTARGDMGDGDRSHSLPMSTTSRMPSRSHGEALVEPFRSRRLAHRVRQVVVPRNDAYARSPARRCRPSVAAAINVDLVFEHAPAAVERWRGRTRRAF
jgi:hypothetical protein